MKIYFAGYLGRTGTGAWKEGNYQKLVGSFILMFAEGLGNDSDFPCFHPTIPLSSFVVLCSIMSLRAARLLSRQTTGLSRTKKSILQPPQQQLLKPFSSAAVETTKGTTRMNLFTAINEGMRTAMQTDPTAVSLRELIMAYLSYGSLVDRSGVLFHLQVSSASSKSTSRG